MTPNGQRFQDHWSAEVNAMLEIYKNFEILIPSPKSNGSGHRGEDGRFVEELLRGCLTRFLPRNLEVLTGFIVRPASNENQEHSKKHVADKHSTQLDIIVYDSASFPIYQRFGNNVIVPPDGVVAIISVKKHLNDGDIMPECKKLFDSASLCRANNLKDPSERMRGPFLSLISMKSNIKKAKVDRLEWVYNQMHKLYKEQVAVTYDGLVNLVGSLNDWSIFKRRPSRMPTCAEYIGFVHGKGESHLGLQFLLAGILGTYYDSTRNSILKPNFNVFPSDRPIDISLGSIPCEHLR